jgi:TatD DNase family protein
MPRQPQGKPDCGLHLADVHCHLFMDPLARDPQGVWDRAQAAGVRSIIVPAYDLASWAGVRAWTQRQGVYGMYGLHPWVAGEPLDVERLEEALRGPGAVGIGEIGLDFKVPAPDRELQVRTLRIQLDAAVRLGLPVALHCRGAFEELLELLEGYSPRLSGILHAFTRGPELAARFVERGLHLSFGGALTRPRAARARRAAAQVALDRIVLETDAPSIGLEGVPPEQTEPRHVRSIAEALAGIRHDTLERIADITTNNARELFRLAE